MTKETRLDEKEEREMETNRRVGNGRRHWREFMGSTMDADDRGKPGVASGSLY